MSKEVRVLGALALAVVLAMTITVSAKHQPETVGEPIPAAAPHTEKPASDSEPPEPSELSVVKDGFEIEAVDLREPAIYIVELEDPAVPSYRGGIAGLEATSPRVTEANKLDVTSPESVAYGQYLQQKQDQLISRAEAVLDRELEVKFRYRLSINGLAVKLTPEEAAKVAKLEGVKSVTRDWVEYALTDNGPAWVGAEGIWDGSATGVATKGEGIIVGIVDTGINHDHPSFADVGDDGYDHTNPWGAGNYTGWCDPANENYTTTVTCNDKLIGLWSFDEDLPEDYNGHGSHVGSTAAGNVLSATFHAPTTEITRTISGVAPHANVIGYSIEGDPGAGSAPGSNILAATEQAIDDMVDVLNYSFGGGPGDPWATAGHWLNVRDAGIFVATSAGNAGPDPGTVGSPGNAPWMLTVANSTHDRRITNSLVNMTPNGPADIEGKGVTAGYGPAEIIYAGHVTNPNDPDGDPAQCLEPFPAGTFNGEIVVCDRGEIARVAKGQNVLAGGAGGFVLANTAAQGESLAGDAHFLPGVHIGATDAMALRAWLTSTVVQTATITGYQLDVADAYGDIMTASSSRGPNYTESILKPDVTAPGTDILAAVLTDPVSPAPHPEFDFYSGTSMASPHVAGVGALLKALHPTWTPAQIQSAIMTTSINQDGILKEDGVTPTDPFDRGSGRAYASAAANAGLLLDETTQDFLDADPSAGGDPRDLNLASFADGECMRDCSWDREVENPLPYTVTWTADIMPTSEMTLTVTPETFELPPGATQDITVAADVTGLPTDGTYVFGGITLVPTTSFTVPVEAFFPVAVMPSSGVIPDLVTINASRDAGSKLIEDLKALEITDLTITRYGMTANEDEFTVSEVPNPGFPDIFFQSGVHATTINVPEGSPRLVVEVLETTSPDLDMMVLFDSDGDGVPEQSDLDGNECQSAAGGSFEYCDIPNPVAGTWFALIANFEESAMAPDSVTLANVAVPTFDAGNLMVEGPETVPAATEFDLRVIWDEPMLEPGDHYYGAFGISSSPVAENDIGIVPVNLIRLEDDVSKSVSPDTLQAGMGEEVVTYTISIQNPRPVSVTYNITDVLPDGVTFGGFTVQGGATYADGVVSWSGVLDAMVPSVEVAEGASPFGYFPMASIGVSEAPCSALCDETILNLSGLDPFSYLGDSYTNLAMVTNGYVMPGGGEVDDVAWLNQSFPDSARPNNVVAPLWTDLDLAPTGGDGAGTWYAAQVSAGAGTGWVVVEWVGAQEYQNPGITHTFQIWLDQFSDDVSMVYGAVDEQLTYGTVGGENADGTLGDTYYYDGAGTAPTAMTELKVRKTGGVPPSHTIQFTATVDLNETVTNTVLSSVDLPYTEVEEHHATLTAMHNLYLPQIFQNYSPSYLQVAHLAPFAEDASVTVMLNGAPALPEVGYGDSTGYIRLAAGEYLVEIVPTGTTTAAISATVALEPGGRYTAIAAGDGVNQDLELIALEDDLTPPAAGHSKLRVGHLAPFAAGSATADIRFQDGTPVLNNIVYGTVTPTYLELPAGEYDLKVTTPGGDVTLIDPLPVTFMEGQILSAFATGDGVNQDLGVFALPAGAPGDFLPLATTLTVLHNNDGESELLPGDDDFGGVAHFASVVEGVREKVGSLYPLLLVTSGDNFLAGPEWSASVEKGVPFYDSIALDLIGYDAMCIGNHDFDFGPDTLADFIEGFTTSQVPFLSANLDFSPEPALQALVDADRIAASVIVEDEGEQFGIVGATTPNLTFISSPGDVVVGQDVQAAVQAEIDALEAAGVNKIILISHLQGIAEDTALAPNLSGLDIMIAGGGDELLANPGDLLVPGDEGDIFGPYPMVVQNAEGVDVPVVTTSGEYEYLGRLDVSFDATGRVVSFTGGPIRVAGGDAPDAVEPDPDIEDQVVDPVAAYVEGLDENVLATSEVPLDGRRNEIRSRETNEGDLIADSFLWKAEQIHGDFGAPAPDVAMGNGGGIRNDSILPAGDVTELDTFNMLPFSNFLTIVPDVTPTEFKALLENAVSRINAAGEPEGEGTGRFAQIGGFSFTYDSTLAEGSRVITATLNDGTVMVEAGAIAPTARDVNVVVVDFLARGGDEYFGGPPGRDDFIILGTSYQQALADYLEAPTAEGGLGGTIPAADYPVGGEGRIVNVAVSP